MPHDNPDIYAECRHIKRKKPDLTVDYATADEIGKDFRVLPSFETQLYEKKCVTHYSLENNELLKCRWHLYKKNIAEKVFSPFIFPGIRDLHFHTCRVRYLPQETVALRPDHRMTLRPGPGVDFQGQMPIPLELQMRRSTHAGQGKAKTMKKKGEEKDGKQ